MQPQIANVPPGKHSQLNYINIFRAVAILFIVAGHCRESSHKLMEALRMVFLTDGTVFFVFISGFLFQYLSDTFKYKEYSKKKFFNVVFPYLITSVPGILFFLICSRLDPFNGINKWVQVPMFLTTGYFHNVPTWYIPMTCIFFIAAPLLLQITSKLLRQKYLGWLGLLSVCLIIPLFIPRLAFPLLEGLSPVERYVTVLRCVIGFNTLLFFPIYIAGMLCAARKSCIKVFYKYRVRFWIIWSLFMGLDIYWAFSSDLPGRLLAPKIIFTFICLGYLEHYDKKIQSWKRINNLINQVAKYSFAVFSYTGIFGW